MRYNDDNIFAQMLTGEIQVDPVYEDEFILAFNDIHPAAPTHVLVIPKGKYTSFHDFAQTAGSKGVGIFFERVNKVVETLGLEQDGFRLITNHGSHAHQTVPHFHIHILGGKPLGPLLSGDSDLR